MAINRNIVGCTIGGCVGVGGRALLGGVSCLGHLVYDFEASTSSDRPGRDREMQSNTLFENVRKLKEEQERWRKSRKEGMFLSGGSVAGR